MVGEAHPTGKTASQRVGWFPPTEPILSATVPDGGQCPPYGVPDGGANAHPRNYLSLYRKAGKTPARGCRFEAEAEALPPDRGPHGPQPQKGPLIQELQGIKVRRGIILEKMAIPALIWKRRPFPRCGGGAIGGRPHRESRADGG